MNNVPVDAIDPALTVLSAGIRDDNIGYILDALGCLGILIARFEGPPTYKQSERRILENFRNLVDKHSRRLYDEAKRRCPRCLKGYLLKAKNNDWDVEDLEALDRKLKESNLELEKSLQLPDKTEDDDARTDNDD